jgi:hypothetical protein
VHKDLEDSLADFLGTEDTILYGSCFDANGGVCGCEAGSRHPDLKINPFAGACHIRVDVRIYPLISTHLKSAP